MLDNNRPTLPENMTVFERGWLSSNNLLLVGKKSSALIDSGYGLHAEQTVALVASTLAGRPLDLLLNTHLHSDHCGGNAALQNTYPDLVTHIPPGLSAHVQDWNPQALAYTPTGQQCQKFGFDALLRPGTDLQLGDQLWQVHAAPGHDPHSVILFEPVTRVLVSADALWERGFGVVFPELEGMAAFDDVAKTIDLIEALKPDIVIPGHGPAFSGVKKSIANARERLAGFVSHPEKHIKYATKVLLKFKLLEAQSLDIGSFIGWAGSTPYVVLIHERYFSTVDFFEWVDHLIEELVRSGAASRDGVMIRNAG